MEGIKGSFPITIRYLPDPLLSVLSKPGKILEAKVETLEGRLVSLFVGEERLEAMLSPEVSPRSLRPGQTVRLKLVDIGPPVILSLLSPETERAPLYKELTRLLRNLSKTIVSHQLLKSDQDLSLEVLLLNTLFTSEKGTKDDKKVLSISGQEKKEFLALLPKFWENGILFLPFTFLDKLSWGFLLEEKKKRSGGERVFHLKLFLSSLGLLEVVFRIFSKNRLYLTILAARQETLKLIQKFLSELYDDLKEKDLHVHIETALLETKPGELLVIEG